MSNFLYWVPAQAVDATVDWEGVVSNGRCNTRLSAPMASKQSIPWSFRTGNQRHQAEQAVYRA